MTKGIKMFPYFCTGKQLVSFSHSINRQRLCENITTGTIAICRYRTVGYLLQKADIDGSYF
jgi:hypothetical protein